MIKLLETTVNILVDKKIVTSARCGYVIKDGI